MISSKTEEYFVTAEDMHGLPLASTQPMQHSSQALHFTSEGLKQAQGLAFTSQATGYKINSAAERILLLISSQLMISLHNIQVTW